MKSVQQLRVLAKNPFYQLTNEEVDILQEADSKQATAYRKNIKKETRKRCCFSKNSW